MHRALIDEVRSRHAPERLFTLWAAARGETTSERFGREVALRWEQAAEDFFAHLASLERPAAASSNGDAEPSVGAGGRRLRARPGGLNSARPLDVEPSPAAMEIDPRVPSRTALSSSEKPPRSRRRVAEAEPAASSLDRGEPDSLETAPQAARGARSSFAESPRARSGISGRSFTRDDHGTRPRTRRPEGEGVAPASGSGEGAPPAGASTSERWSHPTALARGEETRSRRELDGADAPPSLRRTQGTAARGQVRRNRLATGSASPMVARFTSDSLGSRGASDDGGEPPHDSVPGRVDLEADTVVRARLESLLDERERRAAAMREWRRSEF